MKTTIQIRKFISITEMISCITLLFLFLTACQQTQAKVMPSPTFAASTPTITVDCQTLWEQQEETNSYRNLNLTMELNKAQFNYDKLNKREELLVATLALKNMGTTPIWVNKRMGVNDDLDLIAKYGELYFVLISPWGETASFADMVYAGERDATDFRLLGPNKTGETISADIMSYAFSSLRQQNSRIEFPDGKYSVWAVYHNEVDPGLGGPVWMGKIKSNLVEFEVVK
jgi:hypothetical protein